jgi:hypothetical protein
MTLVAKGPPPQSVLLPDIFGSAPAGRPSGSREQGSPAGVWKWTTNFGDQPVEYQLTLKLEGNRLSGTYLRGGGTETPITDAAYRDGTVTFTVVRDRKGEKVVSVYHARVQGDTLRGTVEFGENRKRDWEATRAN